MVRRAVGTLGDGVHELLDPQGVRSGQAGIPAGGDRVCGKEGLCGFLPAGGWRGGRVGRGVLQPADQPDHDVRPDGSRGRRRFKRAARLGGASQPDSGTTGGRAHGGYDCSRSDAPDRVQLRAPCPLQR